MRHINKLILSVAAIASVTFSACSDGDEHLTPSPAMSNYFQPAADDNSREARIRRDFHDATGIYLLFNDTLAIYTDEFGMEKIETVDFNWVLNDHNSIEFSFDYITDDAEKEIAADYLKKYFYPYINVEGGTMKPYSFMLMKNLLKENNRGRIVPASYINNNRCFGVNASTWLEADDNEAKAFGRQLLRELIGTKVRYTDEALADFISIGETCYDEYYIYRVFPDWEFEQDIELIYEAGFLKYSADSWGDPTYDSFMSEPEDLASYLDALILENEADFYDKWSDYPKIIQKYEILKRVIEQLGINLNAVE